MYGKGEMHVNHNNETYSSVVLVVDRFCHEAMDRLNWQPFHVKLFLHIKKCYFYHLIILKSFSLPYFSEYKSSF